MEILEQRKVPQVVAIVAMGMTRQEYIADCMRCGGRHGVADETWVINKLGDVLQHDLVFRMDDLRKVRYVNDKVGKNKDGKTVHERQDEWFKAHDKPIITSKPYPEFPTSVAYPIEAVVNSLKTHYFLSTPAYAIAYAILIGVKCMKLYGLDYVYRENAYVSEQGRGNCEYLISIAHDRGIDVQVASKSTMMANHLDIAEHLYSYEGVWEVVVDPEDETKRKVLFNEAATKKREHESKKQDFRGFLEYTKKYNPAWSEGAQQQLDALEEEYKAGMTVNESGTLIEEV